MLQKKQIARAMLGGVHNLSEDFIRILFVFSGYAPRAL